MQTRVVLDYYNYESGKHFSQSFGDMDGFQYSIRFSLTDGNQPVHFSSQSVF